MAKPKRPAEPIEAHGVTPDDFGWKDDIFVHPDDLAYLRTLQTREFADDDYEVACDCTVRGKVVGEVTRGINRFGVAQKRVVVHLMSRERKQLVFCWLHGDAIDVPVRGGTWWQITGWPVLTFRKNEKGLFQTYLHLNVSYPQMVIPLTQRARAYVEAWRRETFGEKPNAQAKEEAAPAGTAEGGSPAGDPGPVPRKRRSRAEAPRRPVPAAGGTGPSGPAAGDRRPEDEG